MKPDFALSLSFEGIALLHRAAGGWRSVGEVALDSADLAGDLAALRAKAEGMDGSTLLTKLLLPEEQVKFLTIDTPDMDEAARRSAAEAALENATPYAVSELAFDISADGDRTHIAAVARETLEEAEAFAAEHAFNPVSFATVPGGHPFLGEPFFGLTKAAGRLLPLGQTVDPDGIAVVNIGPMEEAPQPKAAAPAAPSDVPAETKPEEQPAEETAKVQAEPVDEAAPSEPPEPETKPAAKALEAPEPEVATETNAAPKVQPPKDDSSAPAAPALGFASRRAPSGGAPPSLGGASRSAAPESSDAAPAKAPTLDPEAAGVTASSISIAPDSSSLRAPVKVPETPEPAPRSGFLSRRRAEPAAAAAAGAAPAGDVIAAPAPITASEDAETEQDRLTIFGARKGDVGGKPRFLGLILTAALLVFLAGVAAWASVFLDDGIKLSRLFGERAPVQEAQTLAEEAAEPAVQEAIAALPEVAAPAADPVPQAEIITASLDPTLTEEDEAVLDALSTPAEPSVATPLSDEELAAKYAATGIWPRAPEALPDPASLVDIEDLYLTSIDPVSTSTDAVALPAPSSFETDTSLPGIASPAAPGTAFEIGEDGLVVALPEGALSPDGYTVFLGPPPLVPPATPTRFQSVPEDTGVRAALAAYRPEMRPSDLRERTERALLGGLTREELAEYRPILRPQSLQEAAEAALQAEPVETDAAVTAALEAAADPFEGATAFAARASLRPDPRPRNFSRIVERAQRQAPAEEVRVASAAAVAPRAVTPKIPSKASVAKQATVRNAINLRKINLIGVYGKPSSRRALVRLSNGRYKKVVVGDRIDGGRVSAIGEGELRYNKRGRDIVLKMPR